MFPMFLVVENMAITRHYIHMGLGWRSGTLGTQGIHWSETGNILGTRLGTASS
jgi:hypothetical protein